MHHIYRRNDDNGKRRMRDMCKNLHRHNGDMAHIKAPKNSEMKALICARFAAAVKAYCSNQAQVARELDIDPRQLNGYVKGKNFPDESLVVRFCDITGCTTDWIYRGIMKSEMPVETAIHIAMESPGLVRQEQRREGAA